MRWFESKIQSLHTERPLTCSKCPLASKLPPLGLERNLGKGCASLYWKTAMTIHITPAVESAYQAYLNTTVDWDFIGKPIQRRDTFPYCDQEASSLVAFAAGYAAGFSALNEAQAAPKESNTGVTTATTPNTPVAGRAPTFVSNLRALDQRQRKGSAPP